MSFKNLSGMLARWIEELTQYDMTILHRKGEKHMNADALSRIPNDAANCNCYFAGCVVENLPCGGCKHCSRIHKQWQQFEDDVNDVIPLAVRQIKSHPSSHITENRDQSSSDQIILDVAMAPVLDTIHDRDEPNPNNQFLLDAGKTPCKEPSKGPSLFTKYSHHQLRALQLGDPDSKYLVKWKEESRQNQFVLTQHELKLLSPAGKYLWSNAPLLQLSEGVLYYRWADTTGDKLLMLVPTPIKGEALQLCHDTKLARHSGITRTLQKF